MFTDLIEKIQKINDTRTSKEKAIDWIKNNRIPNSGIVVHHKTENVTPEVTGYIICSLWNAGERELALELVRWEASVQRSDGAFNAPGEETPYTFDTAQVTRGFLSVVDEHPEFKENIIKACDYLLTQIDEKGEVHTIDDNCWNLTKGRKLSLYSNLYNLTPLIEAGKRFHRQDYVETAMRSLEYYKKFKDLVAFKSDLGTLSHIFGYMMEALVDLGEVELAKKGLAQAALVQKPNGAVPAYPGVSWVCSTGLAQLGIAWYKVGQIEFAEKSLQYLEKIQNPSGGFYGGYGWGAEYFPKKEISWAAKYFIDLYLLVRGQDG